MNFTHFFSLKRSFVLFFSFLFLYYLLVVPQNTSAQTTDPCTSSNIATETHDQLQADLDACNAEIAQWQATLDASKKNNYTNPNKKMLSYLSC